MACFLGLAATEFCNSFDLRGLTLTYGDLVVPYVDMHNLSKILTDFSSGSGKSIQFLSYKVANSQ